MMGPWPLRRRRSVSPNTTVLATIFSSASPNTFHSTPSRARTWCDRRTGIGADGLIFGLPPGPNHDDEGDIVMRLFNSDGSPAALSGNGLRCFAQAVARAQGVPISTSRCPPRRGMQCTVHDTDEPHVVTATVDMGVVRPGLLLTSPNSWRLSVLRLRR